MLVYMLAVFHRSSLGVAGLVATQRFDISATQLATFTMLQLLVYAGMQVPVGLVIDRFGSRSVLLCGLVMMSLAQASFAFADTYVVALIARAFVGIGDAMTFICVLRLVNSWFPSRRIPLVTQLTGTFGQLGAVMAAVPMTWALAHLGWTKAYVTAAAVSLVAVAGVVALLHDAPDHRHLRGPRMSLAAARRTRRTSARSVSMPVSSSSISTPSCATALIIAFCVGSGGNSMCSAAGQSAPRTEGPSSRPPTSWPITAGWPMRCMASPSRRPTVIRATIWAIKTTSDGADPPPAAANAGPAAIQAAAPARPPRCNSTTWRSGLAACRPSPACPLRLRRAISSA